MTERGYLNDIRRKCVALGVWRDEFERVQKRLAKVYCRIDDVEAKYTDSGSKPIITHKNNKGSENIMRNPYLVELDTLYDQALAYEKELGLTAAALKKINESALHGGRSDSPLAEVFRVIEGKRAGCG